MVHFFPTYSIICIYAIASRAAEPGGWFVASHASPPNHISVPLPLACFPHADIYVASSTESSDLIPKLSRCYSHELVINEFRCHEAKIEESEKGQQSPGVEPRTPLS